jgi:DNA invertase Pin-like site-specific DNA recombinase
MSKTKAAGKLRLLGYARISDDDAAEGKGVERQAEDIRREARRIGATLIEPIILENDRGASMHSRKPRPDYDRIVTTLQAGGADGVIAYSLERLTRRFDQGHVLLELGMAGCHIRGITEGIDLADEGGRETYGFILTQAHNESARISRRVKRQQAQARGEGRRHNGSRRLFGYTLDMQIVPDEAKALREMVRLVADGGSAGAAARWANDNGYITTLGNRWSSRTVGPLLANPAISGRVGYYGEAVGSATWEGIVTPEEQAAAVVGLARWRQPGRPSRGRPTPFSGLIVCECGVPMVRATASTGKRSYRSWKCRKDRGGCGSNSITAAVEDYVLGLIWSEALPNVRVRRASASMPRLRSEGDVQADVAALLDARHLLAPEQYRERLVGLEHEMATIRTALASPSSAERLIDGGEDISDVWAALGDDLQRSVLRLILREVRIAKGTRQAWSEDVAKARVQLTEA